PTPAATPRTAIGSRYRPARRQSSYRQDAVLAPGPVDDLGLGHLEPAPYGRAGLGRVDDVVDLGVAGGDVGVDVAPELLRHLQPGPASLLALRDGLELLAHDDVHHAVGAHDCDLGRRPGHDVVGL